MTLPTRIDQILAGYAQGDAISHEARILREIFRGWGIESDIFADMPRVAPGMVGDCRPLRDFPDDVGQFVIHHYAIASPAVDAFRAARAGKIVIYHNITPAHFFAGVDDAVAAQLVSARAELAAVAREADAVWADSAFNARELTELGVPDVRVLPLLFSPSQFDVPPDAFVLDKFSVPLRNILFVGRVAPNKMVEDLILAYAWYYHHLEPASRLIIVGSDRSAPRYYTMLRMLASELDLANVCFEGFVSAERLSAYYRLADVFVCASRHEGYCLPLVEAMFNQVPVIARDQGGMPEALGSGGVRYDDLTPGELAELIHRVLTDDALRSSVLASQEQRMQELHARKADDELRQLMAALG